MKTRRLVLLFSIILCLCMLVACSAEVAEQKAEEQLAYATFKNDSKDFSISYDGYKAFDDLFWYYKANKLDAYGKSGDTGEYYAKVPGNAQGKGLDGKTEALSEGKWQFTLMAFESALFETETGSKRYDAEHATQSAIYSGSTPGASEEGIIVIRRNQTNYIPVTVTPVAKKGHIQFKNAYYEWEAAGSDSNPNVKITINLSAMIDEQPVVYEVTNVLSYGTSNYPISGYIWVNGSTGTIADATPGSGYSNEIPAGVYAASIEITPVGNDDNIIFADQNLSLKVFGGLTATISGSLKELLSLDNYFAVPEVDVKVFNPDPTSEAGTVITSNYVAKDEKTSETTTVTFPQGALTSTNQHSLEVEVFSAAVSESKFVIETETTGSQAVAGLDLTLKKVTRTSEGAVTEETVEEFENSKYATIVTYINPGLEDVAVKYNGTDKDQPIVTDEEVQDKTIAKVLGSDSGLGYNPSTGYLSFKTNHFSEYYVQATVYAQNVTTGKYYHSLREAIDDAQDNQTIKLLKSTETGSSYTIGNPFYVNKNGLTIDLDGKSLTVTNNFSFVIEADNVTVKNGNVVSGVNSGKISGINSYVIVVNNCKNALLDGLIVTGGVSAGGSTGETPNCGAARNMVMMNCTVTGGDYYAVCSQNYSDVTIQSGTYSETEKASENKGVLQGHFIGDDGPEGGIVVTGGTFNGKIKPEQSPNEIVLKGGIYNNDPSAYVAEGYVAKTRGTNPETWKVEAVSPAPAAPLALVYRYVANNEVQYASVTPEASEVIINNAIEVNGLFPSKQTIEGELKTAIDTGALVTFLPALDTRGKDSISDDYEADKYFSNNTITRGIPSERNKTAWRAEFIIKSDYAFKASDIGIVGYYGIGGIQSFILESDYVAENELMVMKGVLSEYADFVTYDVLLGLCESDDEEVIRPGFTCGAFVNTTVEERLSDINGKTITVQLVLTNDNMDGVTAENATIIVCAEVECTFHCSGLVGGGEDVKYGGDF